ncbi:hypothetical protein EA58_13750 [Photobacterium galatheae]|uniref:DotM C-terminal cytoplasmic domain-containing protein n=2 Tax=Photobacterium galatheae TaxID=1654360 RepID=A0A066RK52_9GAMM|nr:hypothetical protein EA58_13750 [Photobacterium galatheae]
MLIAIFAACLIAPWVINQYLLKYYVGAWYWLIYGKVWLLYKITSFPFVSENLDYILFWVDWFIVDSNIPDGRLYPIVNEIYKGLLETDTSSMEAIRNAFSTSDGELSGKFSNTSRFAMAVYLPIYLYISMRITYKLLTIKKFDNVFTLDEFAESMAEGFPELLPVVYDNPLKYDLDEGHWRMSPKIYTYLKNHHCIEEFIDDGKEMFKLNEENLSTLLVEQLGEKWDGFEGLDKNYRTIAAIALPLVNSPAKGKAATYQLIEALGYAYSVKPTFLPSLKKGVKTFLLSILNINFYVAGTSKGKKVRKVFFKDLNGIVMGWKETFRQRKYKKISQAIVEKNISDFQDIPAVKNILKKHAYKSTVIAALIESARLGGVLPSCSSIWLKKENRNLFYVFNNLGRHVSWIEVVGFWSHYLNEKKVEAPFPYPKIENGVEGVDDALYSSFYNYAPLVERDSA